MSETNVLSLFGQPMTEAEYDAERAHLRQAYGDNKSETVAKADQAFARLFYRSSWTQEQLAQKEGKSQQWVSCRLRFGRFLHFTTPVVNPDSPPILTKHLTEGRFRKYWEQTSGDERDRFRAIRQALEEDVRVHRPKGPSLRAPIIEKFGDGKWHALETTLIE